MAPIVDAAGFDVCARPLDDGGVHVRVLGAKRGRTGVVCPVHGRAHTKGSGFGAVYAFAHETRRVRWHCKKPTYNA